VLAGVAVGVALLAKYTAALLAPALLVLVLWDGELRRQLRAPWPWLGAAVAVALFAPCLAWNARHGWISIRFQLGHGFGADATVRSVAEYVLGQLAGAGPVALAAGVVALARVRTTAWKRVAAAALLPLAVTTWAAMRGRVEANWPALAYPALAAAAGARLAAWPGRASRRALAWGSAALALALLALFGMEQRSPRLLAATPAFERFHGGRQLAIGARAQVVGACAAAGCDPSRPFVVPASYQVAAVLGYYGGFDRLGPALERPSQLDVWGARPEPGEVPLLVRAAGEPGTAVVTPLLDPPLARVLW
ncbi:MAG TPA: glycosyltransferase family 39 protein, partial [Anaeromyxobacteraceae bacterium]|nr:glycosyltransferase family 39 protein [Anaeromyxobacteraceae bacterium]